MINLPRIGDQVTVYPDPQLKVLPRELEGGDRRLPREGKVCTWTTWLETLYREGSIHLTDPQPPAKDAAPPAKVAAALK